MQAASVVQKYSDSALHRKTGISTVKFNVLKALAVKGGKLTPSDIARLIIRERHDVTTLVRRMEKDGYIEFEPNLGDRRSVYVILTEKGREKLAQAEPVFDEIIIQSMAMTDERNRTPMEDFLKTLAKNAFGGLAEGSNSFRSKYRDI